MGSVSLRHMAEEIASLSEEERRALRGSKFAPLPLRKPDQPVTQPRLAHPGGPLATNKAAALAKFLERKLKGPASVTSLDPDLVERAVCNAKASINPGCSFGSSVKIRHVDTFPESEEAVGHSCEIAKSSSSLPLKTGILKKKGKLKQKKKWQKQKQKKKVKAGSGLSARVVLSTFGL